MKVAQPVLVIYPLDFIQDMMKLVKSVLIVLKYFFNRRSYI